MEGFLIDYWSGNFTFQISDFRLYLTEIETIKRFSVNLADVENDRGFFADIWKKVNIS